MQKNITFCGIMSALMVVLAIAASIMQFSTLFFLVVLSLIMCVVTQRAGAMYGFVTCAVTFGLMFLFSWDKIFAVEFGLIFGSYPVVKFIVESKIKSTKTEKIIKTVYFAVISAVFVLLAELVFGGAAFWGEWYTARWMGIACGVVLTVMMLVYDAVLSYAIYLFNKKFNGRLFK